MPTKSKKPNLSLVPPRLARRCEAPFTQSLHRLITALANNLALEGDARTQFWIDIEEAAHERADLTYTANLVVLDWLDLLPVPIQTDHPTAQLVMRVKEHLRKYAHTPDYDTVCKEAKIIKDDIDSIFKAVKADYQSAQQDFLKESLGNSVAKLNDTVANINKSFGNTVMVSVSEDNGAKEQADPLVQLVQARTARCWISILYNALNSSIVDYERYFLANVTTLISLLGMNAPSKEDFLAQAHAALITRLKNAGVEEMM